MTGTTFNYISASRNMTTKKIASVNYKGRRNVNENMLPEQFIGTVIRETPTAVLIKPFSAMNGEPKWVNKEYVSITVPAIRNV